MSVPLDHINIYMYVYFMCTIASYQEGVSCPSIHHCMFTRLVTTPNWIRNVHGITSDLCTAALATEELLGMSCTNLLHCDKPNLLHSNKLWYLYHTNFCSNLGPVTG